MALSPSRLIAGLAVCFVAACGAPGAFDLCNDSCDSYARCMYANDAATANCHTDCQNMQGAYSDQDNMLAQNCKNASDIRKQQAACYANTACFSNEVAYTAALAACVADPQANDCIKTN